ncbi:MAG: super-infection exclusion protein B [Gammaproteobacteria bacterium]|nr:super-infection exclusion protein B [Gammaproteobacteria bacterium]
MWKDNSTKQPAHYLFQAMLWLALACALVLFMPESMIKALQLDEFINNYVHFVGILFIISVTYLFIDVVSSLVKQVKMNTLETQQKDQIENRIKTLVTGERAVLREFFLQRKTSLWLPQDESDVKSLTSSGILTAVDFYSKTRKGADNVTEIELIISHNARPYLSKQRLNLPQGKPSYDDINYLKTARPSYLTPVTNLKRTA